jgi:TRAP-type C4-dicarboxylate transport system substrate-binding protein
MQRAAALGLALTMLLAGSAFAADQPIELKLSTWLPPAHPLNPSLQAWAADVEKASNGTIKSTLFTSEQLGKAFDHYDMARDGIADFAYVNPGYQPGRFPVAAAAELPFLMANGKGGSAAFDAWYRKYAAQEMRDVHYCMGFVLDPGTFHARKKIMRPEDISGVKVRPGDATMAAFVTLLGGANVQASAPEARDALERGVADAITFPWGSLVLFGIDKVVKYHMDAALYVSDFVWVMNKTKYEALSPAQRGVIDAHCNTEWAEKIASSWADFEAAGREKVRNEPGHEVYKISADDLAAWRKAAEPLTAKWADGVRKAGVDPDKAMAELRANLEQHQAMY